MLFLSCHVPLLLMTSIGRAETLLISLTAGFIIMLLEAIAWRGQDNLIIPVGMYFLLTVFSPLTTSELLVRFLVILGFVIFVVLWRKRTTLSDSAVLLCALAGYAVWGFWGWFWLMPLALCFLIYIALPKLVTRTGQRPMQNYHAVLRVVTGAFFWLLLPDFIPSMSNSYTPFFLCIAAHAANIISARLRGVRSGWTLPHVGAVSWGITCILFGVLGVVGVILGYLTPMLCWQLPLAVAISLCLFIPAWPIESTDKTFARLWISETWIAVVASCVGL